MFHSKLYRYAVVSAAMLFGASCSEGPTTAPPESELKSAGAPTAMEHGDYIARGYLVKRTFTLTSDTAVTATITPEGGFLSFPAVGLLMYFPEGAVSAPIQVTATALQGNRVAYDFQPHGITFNTPIYVAQELLQTELNTPRANKKRPDVWAGYLYHGTEDILPDGSANFTEVFDAFYYGKGSETLAVFTTTHFSGYAMASGRRESAY